MFCSFKVMTTQGRVTGLGAGFVDVSIEADKYPGVKDIFDNQSLTGRYIRQDTTSIVKTSFTFLHLITHQHKMLDYLEMTRDTVSCKCC